MSYARGPLDVASFPDVLRAAKKGEPWAVEQLFRDIQPRLLRYLRSLEFAAADDLAGEVWLAMARSIGSFDGDFAGFHAWVFTVARRRAADYRRSAGRRPATPTDGKFFKGLVGTSDTAREVIDKLSAQDAVDLITRSLPEEHAELLLLRVLGGLDVLKVAEVMGRSPNWVRVTQHRALRHLADALQTTARQEKSGGEKSGEDVIPPPRPAISTT